jgi:hypothetical protein
MKPLVWLWSGILAGPVAWFLNLEGNFALAPLACMGHGKIWLYLVSALSLLITAVAGGVSYMQLGKANEDAAIAPATHRNLAIVGLCLSAFFLLVIAAQTIPNLILQGCEK